MQVEAVAPGLSTNPSNVLVVESVLPPATFQAFFPRAHSAYTYTNFLRAVAKFPAVCTQADGCRWGWNVSQHYSIIACRICRVKPTVKLQYIRINIWSHNF